MNVFVPPPRIEDGPRQMALDEALLERVEHSPTEAWLRVYGWSPLTLSLGYFQPSAVLDAHPRRQGVAWVRRATGGGAILHDADITYALILPTGHPLARRAAVCYEAAHDALAAWLRSLGVEAIRRSTRSEVEAPPAVKPFLCFLDRDPNDVVVGGTKVIGSAQRRRAGALLQHGSVLLKCSPLAPELPGLADVGGPDLAPTEGFGPVVGALAAGLGLDVRERGWPTEVLERAEALDRSVYRSATWARRR